MSACRSCGAPIFWAITEAGRRMPVDEAPVPDGNVTVIEDDSDAGVPIVRVLGATRDLFASGPLYVSHFVTCPDAAEHRRKSPRRI